MKLRLALLLAVAIGCGGARAPAPQAPTTTTAPPPARATSAQPAAACDAAQIAISRGADARAAPWSISRHLAKNFPDGRVSWLMQEAKYQEYVVKPAARTWGRCTKTASERTTCYLFAAPAAVLH